MAEEVCGPETTPEISPGQLRLPELGTVGIVRQRTRSERQRVGIVFRSSRFEDEKAHKL